ncbi:MAG: CAP domain-containing protein [Desulfococcaceae bacterium]
MKRLLAIFILLSFFCFGLAVNIRAEEDSTIEPSAQELRLLELINEARRAPLDMAVSLGMDREQILRDLPELEDVLTQGMKPVAFNLQLYLAATAHNKDMLTNNYYSHTSLDGQSYKDRISDRGILSLLTGERLGMISFKNFISSNDAVEIIFENMFRAELAAAANEEMNMLNPDMEKIGISLQAGALHIGGESRNAYLTVCDFAGAEIDWHAVEEYFYRRVNAFRVNPVQALEGKKERKDEVFEDLAWWGIQPLSRNSKLYESASRHVNDMINRVYFDTVSPEGMGPFERSESVGYSAKRTEEVLGICVVAEDMTAKDIAESIYENLLSGTLQYRNDGFWKMVQDSGMREVGIAVQAFFFDIGASEKVLVCVLVADFADPADQVSFIMGNVYRGDKNADSGSTGNDGICQISGNETENGIPEMKVYVTPFGGKNIIATTVTGTYGNFQMEIPGGFSELLVEDFEGNVVAVEYVYFQGQNVWKDIWVCP